MAGVNHPKSLSNNAPSSSTASSHRKSRWESPRNLPPGQKPKPKPSPQQPSPAQSKPLTDTAHAPFPSPGPPFPLSEPPPPPAYGFHMLDRRTIVLADGSVRSYFALPPDYNFTSHRSFLRTEFDNRFPTEFSPETAGFREHREYWNKSNGGPDGSVPGPVKRKYGVDEEKERQFLMPHAKPNRDRLGGTSGQFGEELRAAKYMRTTGAGSVVKHHYDEVDQSALKKAFLHFVKVINENVVQRKSYLEDGKQGRLQCIACRRFDHYRSNVIL